MRPPLARPLTLSIALGVAFVLALGGYALARQSGLDLGPGDDATIEFRHLTTEDGLPGEQVYAVVQDALGFIWIGTSEGLGRYDGAEVRDFQHSRDSTTLSSEIVQALSPGLAGDVWVGTAEGLDLYRAETEAIRRIGPLAGADVYAVAADSAGGAWVGTSSGLVRVVPEGDGYEVETLRHRAGDAASLPSNVVQAIELDPSGDVWVGTDEGLARYSPASGRFRTFRSDSTGALNVGALDLGSDGTLWVGTLGSGLFALDVAARQLRPVDVGPSVAPVITAVYEDRAGVLWVGTLGDGLRRVTPGGDPPRVYRSEAGNLGSLLDDDVSDVMEDRQGVLWVATYSGLDRFDRARGRSLRYRHDPENPASIASNEVLAVLPMPDGSLYVGTDRTLDWSPDGKTFEHRTIGAAGGREAHPVTTLYRDRAGVVWVGTGGAGLYRVTPDGLEKVPIDSQTRVGGTPVNLTVMALLEDRQGHLWIGTETDGLIRYTPETGDVAFFDKSTLGDGRVYALAQTPDRTLWVGTGNGLCRLAQPTPPGAFSCFQADPADPDALANANVTALRAMDDGTLWVGTRGGLHRTNVRQREAGFTRYTVEETDLPGSVVYAIVPDGTDYLWLSTSGGLAQFEPVTGTFTSRLGSGLGADRTLNGAMAMGPGGRLYVGGTAGLLTFEPGQLESSNPNPPQVVITHVDVNGEPVEVGPDAPLAVAAPIADRLSLGADVGYVTFHYAGLHFSDPGANTYRYRMDGVDSGWRPPTTDREAEYNNLGPGRYTFRVQAANADGVWSETEAALDVTVHPPWYRTVWAYLAYLVLAGFAVLRADQWQRRRLLRRERERADRREAELRAETAEAEQRKAVAEAAVLKAENDRKAAELERTREVQEANDKLAAANGRLETSLRELKSTQTQLVQSEKLASLGQLTAGIAHEIKNPLNFVNNFADLQGELADELEGELREGADRPVSEVLGPVEAILDDLRENAKRIREHGQRADRIVRAMLLHSRGGSSDRARIDVNRFVDEYANLAYHGARANDADTQVDVQRDFDPEAGEADVIPQELGRVLINLLTNAFHAVAMRRHAEGDGYVPTVTVGTEREGDWVVLQVVDNGTGMPDSVRQRIFEPFFTTKPTGEGTGLGLSLAHDIVTQVHGGEIGVESEEGVGTAFTIRLPTEAPVPADEPRPPARRSVS